VSEQERHQLEEALRQQKISWFFYDIPTRLGIPNPSPALRREAIRINLSCWIVPSDKKPWELYKQLQDAGAKVNMYEFSVEETPKLLQAAIDFAEQEIKDYIQSARDSADAVELNDSEQNTETRQEQAEKHVKRRKEIVKRCNKFLEDLGKGFAKFGLDARGCLGVDQAAKALKGIQDAMRARADAYVKATNALRAATSRNNEMVKAMEQKGVPPLIAADYSEDHNVDATGLRIAFAE